MKRIGIILQWHRKRKGSLVYKQYWIKGFHGKFELGGKFNETKSEAKLEAGQAMLLGMLKFFLFTWRYLVHLDLRHQCTIYLNEHEINLNKCSVSLHKGSLYLNCYTCEVQRETKEKKCRSFERIPHSIRQE